MESQDHKKAASHSHSGHEGHHVCHKCGWPFPNPHPSARHRSAHKRVCGTIDGYKLDNDNNSDSQDKNTPHLEGSDGEQHVSDDDHKIPPSGGKAVERTISRRSSSGVGSRSSRSTRSDDDVFADAVTEFTESPTVSRENSLQNVIENEPNGDRLAVENAIADNLSASNIVLEGKQLQGIQALEDENENVEGDLLSQDHIPGSKDNPVPVYASVPREIENASELNMMQASRTFCEPNVIAEEAKEIGSSKNDSKHGTGHGEKGEQAPEDVPIQTGASEELLYSVSPVEMGQTTGLQTFDSEERAECYHGVDSSGNSQASLHSVQVVEAADGDTSKSLDLVEEHGSLIGANENAFVLAVPDSLPIHEHPEIPVDELDHEGGKVNVSMAPDTNLAVERVEHGKPHATEERSPSIDFTKQGESSHVCSLDDIHDVHSKEDMLEQEVKHKKSTVEQKTVGEQEQISDGKTSDSDISRLMSEEVFEIIRNETGKDQKSTDLSAFSEGATVVGGDDIDANACDSVRDKVKLSVVHESDVSKVSVQELAATNSKTLVKPAADDIAPNDEGLVNVHERGDNGCDEKARVEGIALNENEMRIGEAENKPSSPGTTSDFGLTMTGSDDKNDDLFELERNYNHEKLNTVIDSGNVMVVHSQVESPLTSPYESNTGGEESLELDKTVDATKIDGHLDSNLKMSENAGSSFSNSAAGVDHISGKLADNASDVNEGGDLMTKEHASVSAVDVGDSSSQTDVLESNKAPGVNEGGDRNKKERAIASAVDVADSGSQTDSLEGNWGSVSVLSTVSDALPVTDTTASNNSKPSTEAGIVSLDPKAVGEAQHSEGKTSVEPDIEFTQRESASEIQSQQQSSALHTGWSSSAANLANESLGGGRRDEEIIAKVNDWSDGKQHTALKTLLGEAIAKSRAESPSNEDSGSMPRMDEIPVTNNGFSAKTEKSSFKASKEEVGKEWNSPARYPVNIKTEKRRAKSRPYWAPFICCSSVNAR